MTPRPRTLHQRRATTLLEVLLALAVFVASASAAAQLLSIGLRAADRTQRQSEAVLRCESEVAQLQLDGDLSPGLRTGRFADNPKWSWSSHIEERSGMLKITMTVTHSSGVQHAILFWKRGTA